MSCPKKYIGKNIRMCCVSDCGCSQLKNPDVKFHHFPKKGTSFVERLNYFGKKEKIDRRDAWMKVLKINLNSDVTNMFVCSAHFNKADYVLSEYACITNPRLRCTAVPSQNIPSLEVKTNNERQTRREARTARRNKQVAVAASCADYAEEFQDLSVDQHVCTVEDAVFELNAKIAENKSDVGVQVNIEFPSILTFASNIKTDATLNTLCGIRNFDILNEIVKLVDEQFPRSKGRRLTTNDQIILVMMKLKLDLSFSVLSILFDTISQSTCSDTFYDMLEKLSCIMHAIIQPVSHEEISNNMPHCFKDFEDTVIVLDCTEIHTQRPKCVKCRIKMYSQYKSDFTFKFMTGVTPAGLLTFVSKAYGGRASDKAIFEQSNVIGMLRRDRDAIMVDKGFLIDDVCAAHGIKLIRPPFLRSKKQFTEEEALLNRQIAAARVHVERMNQRIRQFNILNKSLAWNLWNHINKIFMVCCGFANLGTPIISDDKFM